jgi:hypothetical protein
MLAIGMAVVIVVGCLFLYARYRLTIEAARQADARCDPQTAPGRRFSVVRGRRVG